MLRPSHLADETVEALPLVGVAAFGGIEEPQIVFLGELRVDGQPDAGSRSAAGPGRRTAYSTRLSDPGLVRRSAVLVRREDLLEKRAELDLAEVPRVFTLASTRLRSPTPVPGFASRRGPVGRARGVADEPERIPEALLEGLVELLVDGQAHPFELLLVALLQLLERASSVAGRGRGLLVRLCEALELQRHAVELLPLQLAETGERGAERVVCGL